jgi:hypothetical protein
LIGSARAQGTPIDVTNNYATGRVFTSGYRGGFVGYSSVVSYTSNYWDVETSRMNDGVGNLNPDPVGVTGNTTRLMMMQATFTDWDFTIDGNGPGSGVWIMAGYPHLQMEFNQMAVGSRIVTNVVELQMMALDLSEDYVLAGDIIADGSDPANPDHDTRLWNWNGSYYEGFAPVGNTTGFKGTFDGKGHVVDGLTIDRRGEDNLGLFGFADTGATLTDVGLTNVNVNGYGAVVASNNVAGLAGKNKGTITDCYVTGTVQGDQDVGGIAGENEGGTIERCYADITVPYRDVSGNIGALVGYNNGGTIGQSYGAGHVEGSYFVGGLLGRNEGAIEDCYAAADVEGIYYVGGFVGFNWGNDASILRSYATGDVTATGHVGGFVGRNEAPDVAIEHCFATGDATGDTTLPTVGTFLGSGNTHPAVSNYYSGQAVNLGPGGTITSGADPTTDAGLFNAEGPGHHPVYDTWDFVNVWREHPSEEDFPHLQWEPGE